MRRATREGLVVVQMAEVSPTPFASYGEAQEYLADLAQQALALPEPDRRLYYTQACTSLWSFCASASGKAGTDERPDQPVPAR